jgi:hypothetical protein
VSRRTAAQRQPVDADMAAHSAAAHSAKVRAALDRGELADGPARLVKTLRALAEEHVAPFIPPVSDLTLGRAAYFEEGPRACLRHIERLFDMRQAAYKKSLAKEDS